jgi:outer membrane receptor for ferrienterochelin and colicin
VKKILSLLVLIPILLNAGTTGKLAGKLTEAGTSEPLIGANIILEGTSLGAASNVNGDFVVLNIPPGTYTAKISSIGYKSILVENIQIVVDRTTNLSYSLQSTSLEIDEVVVTARTPLVQPDLTSSISVMTRDEIEELPVASFTELLQLQAGVVGSGSNLHVRGGRSNEVAYMVDGMYVTDPLLGGLATQIGNDAIQEMSLLSGTFNAEYGNALSGVVNIVTRDGSEDYTGKIEIRTSEFGIKRYEDLHELRINGNLGGPLFTNNLTFFITGEQDKRGSYLPFGFRKNQTFFGKLSYTGIYGIKLSVSNRGSLTNRQGYSHRWKYIPDQYLISESDSYQGTFTLTHTVQNNLFYDLRVSYFNQGYYSGLRKPLEEYVDEREFDPTKGNGISDFYKRADPDNITDSRTATIDTKLDLVWQLGRINEIKFGLQYKKHRLRLFEINRPAITFPRTNIYSTQPFEAAAYIQDKIELAYLVINLGLRFDYMDANAQFRQDPLDPDVIVGTKARTQISPRVGIAHPISERTKLHFAYGHFFQNPEYQFLFENQQYDYNVREPIFGQASLDAQRTIAYEVGVSHQLSDRVALNFTAYYKDVTGLIGTQYFPIGGTNFTAYTVYVNEAYANMKGFEINVDARSSKYFGGGLTYTFSVAKGSASSENELYGAGDRKSTLLYYLDFDKTHAFNASATFMIPKDEGPTILGNKLFQDMDVSFIIRASSGFPYTPGGRDVGFVIKNSLRMPGTYTIDMEIGKNIEFIKGLNARIFAEVLNLTDRRNVVNVYTDTGEPDITFFEDHSEEYIKNPANFGPPRTIRLGMGVRF